ncbi:MAG TPA: arylamine N-acetyltransferase [Nevskiaceae bacterium]|nr:arylamine N-acetyltransferase [Nevskiaceae bacterium]
MFEAIDLETYFARIGYTGARAPVLAVLHAITQAHTESIPFENLDVLLGHRIRLEPQALFAKLVTAHRGGYCFEQNGLLMQALMQLGFVVRPLSARVRLGTSDHSFVPPRTHMLLEVQLDGDTWLTDVGVGSASLTRALRFVADVEQPTPHESRRLVRADDRWFHQILRGGQWSDVYEFTGETMPFIDREVASWYVSTHPDSHFRREMLVARALPGGQRVTLLGRELKFWDVKTGVPSCTAVSAAELPSVLRRHFGIELPADARLD